MKVVFTCFCIFASNMCLAALPPPQGKSIQPGSNYDIHEKPLDWYDVAGRVEKRNRLIDEENKAKSSEAPKVSAIAKKPRKKDSIKITASSAIQKTGNLPSYYEGIDRSEMKASDRVVFVPQNSSVKLLSVKSGDEFYAIVEDEIKASPSVPTPIRATVVSGALKGGFFIGEATLDHELKRILLNFTKVRSRSGQVYAVKATGKAPRGTVGLEGEYHSQSGMFFIAELASATAAGFLDSTINRNQNALGNYVQEPSLQNSAKAGAVTALSRSADRMAEQVRQAPEYTDIEGYQPIKIIVQDDPTEMN